ncbi:hypothetical protein ACJX0J_033426, partial [Zea mays]
ISSRVGTAVHSVVQTPLLFGMSFCDISVCGPDTFDIDSRYATAQMDVVVITLSRELSKLQPARATHGILDHIMVENASVKVALNRIVVVSVLDAHTLRPHPHGARYVVPLHPPAVARRPASRRQQPSLLTDGYKYFFTVALCSATISQQSRHAISLTITSCALSAFASLHFNSDISGTLPCIVLIPGLFFIVESPRRLAKMNIMDDCETSLQVLRGFDADITSELNDIK